MLAKLTDVARGDDPMVLPDRPGNKVPLAVKLVLTAFVAVLVSHYWVTYTPWNFLFFCDLALLMTLAAI
jgi:hypothetical protein